MNKCPHCGSEDSFEYIATLVTLRIGEWGKDVDEEVRIEYSVFPKTVKCSSCGKRVKWDVAHGVAVEQSVQADGCPAGGSHVVLAGSNKCMQCGKRVNRRRSRKPLEG